MCDYRFQRSLDLAGGPGSCDRTLALARMWCGGSATTFNILVIDICRYLYSFDDLLIYCVGTGGLRD